MGNKPLCDNPQQAAGFAIEMLAEAEKAVKNIVAVRRKNKLSANRSANVAREINDLIKVLKLETSKSCVL